MEVIPLEPVIIDVPCGDDVADGQGLTDILGMAMS
jgi:hypothetical protein